MESGEHLKAALSAAVPLWIAQFQDLPWSQLQAIATEASQQVAEHGDDILFKSKRKGDTAKAFNHLAKGVAVLAFAPGGVKIMGMEFEAFHPGSSEEKGQWLYHPIMADQLPIVAKRGLVPDDDDGKLSFTDSRSQAASYAGHLFAVKLGKLGVSWQPLLLRVHSAHLGDLDPEEFPVVSDNWYVERKVPAVFIQVWVSEKMAWVEVREAVNQLYFTASRTQYGQPENIDVDPKAGPMAYAFGYILQFWPRL